MTQRVRCGKPTDHASPRVPRAALLLGAALVLPNFGMLGFLLTPEARAMGYVAAGSFFDAPRAS